MRGYSIYRDLTRYESDKYLKVVWFPTFKKIFKEINFFL